MRRSAAPRLAATGMAIVAALQLWLAWGWAERPASPPHWDPAVHLDTAYDYKQALEEGRWASLLFAVPRPGHPAYPPAYHLSLIPAASSADPQGAVVWTNLLYWLLLCYSCAAIAWQIAGPWAGLAALLALGFSPAALTFRQAFADVSLAAWVAAAYAFFVGSRNYEDRRLSLATGLCAGLAMMSKWTALIYLLPCWVAGLHDRRARRNLAAATAVAVVMAGPWYLLNAFNVVSRVMMSAGLGASEGDPTGWTLAAWGYYLRVFFDQYTAAGCLLLLAGCAWAAFRSRAAWRRRPEPALAAWLLISYAFWSSVSNKDDRYILPAAAALPALGAAAFPIPALALSAVLAARGLAVAAPPTLPAAPRWPIDEILNEAHGRGPATVCVLANHESLNTTSLRWLARHAGLGGLSFGCSQSSIPEWADLVLVKTKSPGYYLSERSHAIIADSARPGSPFSAAFRERRRWDLPDGSQAVLFEQRPREAGPRRAVRLAAMDIRSARLSGVVLEPAGGRDYVLSVSTLTMSKFPAPVRDIRLRLEGARLFADQGTVRVLGVSAVRVLSADLGLEEAAHALSLRTGLPWQVTASGGVLAASTRLGWVAARVELVLIQTEDSLLARIRRLSLAGIPIPGAGLLRYRVSLAAKPPAQPYALRLGAVHLDAGRIQIGP